MESVRGTQRDLLVAVRDRVRSKLRYFDEASCYISDNAIPDQLAVGYLQCSIAMADGVFPEGFFTGGGHSQLVESSQIVLTVLKQNDLDQPEHLAEHLIEDEGLLSYVKFELLRAMLIDEVDHDITPSPTPENPEPEPVFERVRVPWMPVRADGEFFLRNQLAPVSCTYPRPIVKMDDNEQSYLGMELRFSAVWDWEL